MAKGGPEAGSGGGRFGPGEGPQTLAQLQSTGAEVVGSDGENVGDLKTVGDAHFVVGRTLRRDLHVPVKHVREVTTDNKIVLDVSADEAKKARWGGPSTDTSGGAEGFSDSARVEKGGLELGEENTQETNQEACHKRVRTFAVTPTFSRKRCPSTSNESTLSLRYAYPRPIG